MGDSDDRLDRKRPLSVIESDMHVTRLGYDTCRTVTESLLEQRYRLLSEGWPSTHPLCVALDKDAERWATHVEQMRRSLGALTAEMNQDEVKT